MSTTLTTRPGQGLSATVYASRDLTGYTTTVELSTSGKFSSVTTKTPTVAGRVVTFSLTSAEVDSLKDCHYRVKATKDGATIIVEDGSVDYISSVIDPSVNNEIGKIVTGTGIADSAALLSAFNAMKVNGHATGRLILKGTIALDAAVVLDGGYTNAGSTLNGGAGEQFVLDCSGAHFVAAPNLGAALTVRNFYGAKIDARFAGGGARRKVTNAAITSGQAILTSATASFTSSDVGKFVRIEGASTSGEAPLCARINSVTNATTAVIDINASTTVSNASCTIMDIALHLDSLVRAEVIFDAVSFAGLGFHVDDAGNNGTGVHQTTVSELRTFGCGMGLFVRANVGDFGQFIDVWDGNNIDGAVFANSADVTLGHFENFSPATQTVGVLFDQCGEAMHIKTLALGDRATEALVKIVNLGSSSTTPTIDETYLTGYKPGANPTITGMKVVDSTQGQLGLIHSNQIAKVLHLKGAGATARVQAAGSDGNAAYVEGSAAHTTPKIDLTLDTFFSQLEPVVVMSSITGGYMRVRGTIDTPNSLGDASKYLAINCASVNMIVDVSGLREFGQSLGAGSINHPTPDNIRGIRQAVLSKTVKHGIGPQTFGVTPVPGTSYLNGPREMVIGVKIDCTPTAGNDSYITIGVWPNNGFTTSQRREIRRAPTGATGGTQNTSYSTEITVPPFWNWQIDLSNATVDGAFTTYYYK